MLTQDSQLLSRQLWTVGFRCHDVPRARTLRYYSNTDCGLIAAREGEGEGQQVAEEDREIQGKRKNQSQRETECVCLYKQRELVSFSTPPPTTPPRFKVRTCLVCLPPFGGDDSASTERGTLRWVALVKLDRAETGRG